MNESTEIIELAIEELNKMDIGQFRVIATELDESSTKLQAFKEDPTGYLKERMYHIPKGFHAHYAEGRNLEPAELVEEGNPTERLAFSIPIGKLGTMSACVFCFNTCCTGK